jgi:hypothetical protein
MQREMTTRDGRVWRTHDALSYGDYSGCMVERANVKALSEDREIMQWPMNNIHWNTDRTVFQPIELRRSPEAPYLSDWCDVEIESDVTAIEMYGGYGSIELWLLDSEETREALDALDNYPSVDDDLLSHMELEAEYEAFDNDIKADLARKAPWDRCERLHNYLDSLSRDVAWECYREACEATNTYPVFETGGDCYVDIDRIWPAYMRAALSRRHVKM